MQNTPRYLQSSIAQDALPLKKIVFVSGPRQVGKTTLAKSLLESPDNYFSYDQEGFRRAWARNPGTALSSRAAGLVVLDEIHKDRLWKKKLKGLYDTDSEFTQYLVTGSARLDLYRKGSDSLMGRYLPYRLHPISIGECISPPTPDDLFKKEGSKQYALDDLLNLGGFPEPLLHGSQRHALRWSRLRLERLVHEDTRDLLNISDLRAFNLLAELLPDKVGSQFSLNSMREDLSKAYATVVSWYQVLEALYFCFTIKPYYKKINRAIRAEPKVYLFDLLRIPASQVSKRLENLTALHLLKACNLWTDTAQGEFTLHYVRDKNRREVDFLVVRNNHPWLLIECKSGQKEPATALQYYSKLLNPTHRIQLVTDKNYDKYFPSFNTRVLSYEMFFAQLP